MNESKDKLYWAVMLLMGAVCGAALALSWAGYRSARSSGAETLVAEIRGELDALDARVLGLRKRVDGMRNVADMMSRGRDNGFHPSPSERGHRTEPDEGGSTAGIDPARLDRMEALLGSESIGAVAGMEPEVLTSMQQDYQRRKAAAEYHKRVRLRHKEQLAADADKYDAERLEALYNQARSSAGEGNAALEVLLEEYPESNATGMALAERALEAALSSDTSSVEQYYRALTESGNFNDVVTDMGVEAVPTVQAYLINQYIAEGRFDEAEAILGSMSSDFTDSYVADVGQGGEPQWVPVSDMAQGISTAIEQIRSGDTSVLLNSPGGGGAGGGGSVGPGSGGAGSTPGGGSITPQAPGSGPGR